MSMVDSERETTINLSDADDMVRIYSAQRTVISRLRKDSRITEVETGVHEGTEFAFFEIPADQWNPVSGMKRRVNMTEEQKRKNVERLRRAREEKA